MRQERSDPGDVLSPRSHGADVLASRFQLLFLAFDFILLPFARFLFFLLSSTPFL
jgi:hypothetical protein